LLAHKKIKNDAEIDVDKDSYGKFILPWNKVP